MGWVVLDVGKTLAKLSLWQDDGTLILRRTRPNRVAETTPYRRLDVEGIENWMWPVLSEFARLAPIKGIVPVGHGAGAAIVRGGRAVCAPMDYEDALPPEERQRYDAIRDPFSVTGSPKLPGGLNLGAQLHRLEGLVPDLFDPGTQILPWPQFWAWRLSGVAASEVSSLGCHTDLWQPVQGAPSPMAVARGWAQLLAPIRPAEDVLGPITREVADHTGLPSTTLVYCGMHDSNAALTAARGFTEIADYDSTVLSTGTWFVAMRSLGQGQEMDIRRLPEQRDCLVNVDVRARPVPSARSMCGREIELLTKASNRSEAEADQATLLSGISEVLKSSAMVLPTMVSGVGPFPTGVGRWQLMPADAAQHRAAVDLYAALVADASLDLIGARGRLLVEGRFAESQVFVRALARLRPETRVYVGQAHNDVSYGALRLVDPAILPQSRLMEVQPLDADLTGYREQWRQLAEKAEGVA